MVDVRTVAWALLFIAWSLLMVAVGMRLARVGALGWHPESIGQATRSVRAPVAG